MAMRSCNTGDLISVGNAGRSDVSRVLERSARLCVASRDQDRCSSAGALSPSLTVDGHRLGEGRRKTARVL